tara:strand:- start:1422 stop:1859 length:438 start_codon:yes stop_codon:yes gene_type:complete
MENPKKLILRILIAFSVILILLIGLFFFVIKKNGITEFDQKAIDYKPTVVKTEKTTPEFELGKEIFMEDCRKCHVSKYMKHNYLSGVVEKVGINYLKTYLAKQDSLLKAKDDYALELKDFWGNNGTIHKFNYTENELNLLIEYLK